MRRAILPLLVLASATLATTAGAQAPTTTDPGKWVPIPLEYWIHEYGACEPQGRPQRSVDRENSNGESACKNYPDPIDKMTHTVLTFEATDGIPVAIPPDGRSAAMDLWVDIDRTTRDICKEPFYCGSTRPLLNVTFRIDIGPSSCSQRVDSWWWGVDLPSSNEFHFRCTLSGGAPKTSLVKVTLDIHTSAEAVINFEGDKAAHITLGVLLNPYPVPVLPPSKPVQESPAITGPAIALAVLIVAALLRRRA